MPLFIEDRTEDDAQRRCRYCDRLIRPCACEPDLQAHWEDVGDYPLGVGSTTCAGMPHRPHAPRGDAGGG